MDFMKHSLPLIIILFLSTSLGTSGYKYREDDFLDQIIIPATGEIVESDLVLDNDVHYEIVVTGIYRYDIGEAGEFADAQYQEDDNDQWTIRSNAVEFDGVRLTAHVFDLEQHTYKFIVSGKGQRMTFRIYDEPNSYSDNDGFLTATIYLYEPGETWNPAIDTPFDWFRHDCVWFDDGSGPSEYNLKVYCFGGRTGETTEEPDIWKYDPLTDVWSDTADDVYEDVSNYTANLLWDENGLGIYIVGGTDADNSGGMINLVQRYYPATGIFQVVTTDPWPGTLGGLPTLPGACVSVLDYTKIYCFGGAQHTIAPYLEDSFYMYDPLQPAGSRWSANINADMPQARGYIQSAVQDNFVYSMGGDTFDGSDLAPHAEVYRLDATNPDAGWVQLASMPVASGEGRGFGFSVDTLQAGTGKLYVVGGGDWPSNTAEVMEYDIATNTWNQAFPDLIEPRRNHAGFYIPLCTQDPTDGLPGMWVVGGRLSTDVPPFATPEYYPMECQGPVAEIDLVKTVGTDSADCAETNRVIVPGGTEVTYCFRVTNTGEITFTQHDLVDSELGGLLVDIPSELAPGESTYITETAVIHRHTINEATWIAWVDEDTFAVAVDTAEVIITPATSYMPVIMKGFLHYYPGPWESEDNDTWSQANGYLHLNQDYYGYPDDQRDWFSIYLTQPGSFVVDLSGHTGVDVQMHVYYQVVDAVHRVCYLATAPYRCDINGQAGSYYIFIYTNSGFNSNTAYTLRITP